MENIEIIAAESGSRIDAWLSANVPDLTRNAAQRLLSEGMVLVNGKPPKKNYKVSAGDTVTVTVFRSNEEIQLSLTFDEAVPQESTQPTSNQDYYNRYFGGSGTKQY